MPAGLDACCNRRLASVGKADTLPPAASGFVRMEMLQVSSTELIRRASTRHAADATNDAFCCSERSRLVSI